MGVDDRLANAAHETLKQGAAREYARDQDRREALPPLEAPSGGVPYSQRQDRNMPAYVPSATQEDIPGGHGQYRGPEGAFPTDVSRFDVFAGRQPTDVAPGSAAPSGMTGFRMRVESSPNSVARYFFAQVNGYLEV